MRQSGSSNDFIISLKRPFTLINQLNYFRVRVDTAIIPHCIKQINSNNNILTYTYTKNSIVTNSSITLTAGNYNILTLLDELKAKLLVNISNVTFTFTYNRNTGFVNLQMAATDGIPSFLLLNFASNSKLGLFFGIIGDVTVTTTAPAGITSSQNVNVNPITYLTIRCSTLKQSLDFEYIVEKDTYSDVMAIVPINVLPGSFILYNNSPSLDISNKVIDILNIYIADNMNYSLSLGNLDWSLSLIFDEIGINVPDHLLNDINTTNPELIALQKERDQLINEVEPMQKQLIDQLTPYEIYQNNNINS
jgi:hypothetical protein